MRQELAEAQHNVVLGLGSNVGVRTENLRLAVQAISIQIGSLECSSCYESEPLGHTDQPRFCNIAASGLTRLAPRELLGFIKQTEKSLGRVTTFRNGPRVIDIDIIFYGDVRLDEKDLVIPHPRWTDRAFVLAPLRDLFPDLKYANGSPVFQGGRIERMMEKQGVVQIATSISSTPILRLDVPL